MPKPRDWTEQLPARGRPCAGHVDDLAQRAEPHCEGCDGTGITPAGDVCGCVDW